MHRPAQHPAHHLLHHLVVAVAAVEVVAEFLRAQQLAHELAGADLAGAQLRFQHRVPVSLEGVKEHLAVGLLDQGVAGGTVALQGHRGALAG